MLLGAGKTTLLNVLTARNLSNFAVDGTVKINGQVADVNKITAMSAYVQQQDLFIATLTVREHLTFQALVRMDPTTSDVEKVQRVNEVMKELSLEKCADNLVGGTLATGKGISGGELKRLAFACEVLSLACHTHTLLTQSCPPNADPHQAVHFVLRRAHLRIGFVHGCHTSGLSRPHGHRRTDHNLHHSPARVECFQPLSESFADGRRSCRLHGPH